MSRAATIFLSFVMVALAAPLAMAAGPQVGAERRPQSTMFVGRYVGDDQTPQGTRTIAVALRSTNVALVLVATQNSSTPQRGKGHWETGSVRNQIRVRLDNGDEYEFFYRNNTLTGGRIDRNTGRQSNRLVLTKISEDTEGELPTNIREMSLTDTGNGEFTASGGRPLRFDRASVNVRANGRTEMTFEGSNARTVKFIGYVTRFDNHSFQVSLVNADNTATSGTADVTYQSDHRIESIRITGSQEDRKFTASFNGRGGGSPGGGPGSGRDLNLNEQGTGFVQFGSRLRESLVRATVTVKNGQDAEITLRRSNDNILRLSGHVERMGNGSMYVRLTSSGNANASGTADIQYREPSTIFAIKIDATMDGQRLTSEFRRDENTGPLPPNTPGGVINLSQDGRGTYEIGNQRRTDLNRAVVTVDREEHATIELRDQDGRAYRFFGIVANRDAYSIKINLTEFSGGLGRRTVSGTADITYGRNTINAINISGRMNNERLLVDFSR